MKWWVDSRYAMLKISMRRVLIVPLFVLSVAVFPRLAYAYQPVMENRPNVVISTPVDLYEFAMPTGDPTFASYAIFGSLQAPGEVDMYVFVAAKDESIPVGLDVPAKTQFSRLRPTVVLIGPYLSQEDPGSLPFEIPLGKSVLPILSTDSTRMRTFDLMSLSWYYEGTHTKASVTSGEIYYLAVFDPSGATGDYVVKLGSTENFSRSVMSTVPIIEPGSLVFETTRPEDLQRAQEDASFRTQTAKQWFFTRETPFENLDSRIKLFFDLAGFYVLRIPAWLR